MPVILPILLILGGAGAAIAAAAILLSNDHDKPPDLLTTPPDVNGLPQTRWKHVNEILPELKKAADSSKTALGLLVGWIAKESGGVLATHPQPGPGDTKLDERGYFQLMPEESASLGLDHQRLSADSVYSINAGLLLIGKYAKKVDGLGIATRGTPYFNMLTKLWHTVGGGDVETMVNAAKKAGQAGSWEALEQFALSSDAPKVHHSPKKWYALVDKVREVGEPFGFGTAAGQAIVGAPLPQFADIPDPLDVIQPDWKPYGI